MKIGIFTDTYMPQTNGVVTSVRTFKEELEKNGHEVMIFCPCLKNDVQKQPDIVRFYNFSFPQQPEHKISVPFAKNFKISNINQLNLDIIHTQAPFGMGILGIYLARKYNIPAVFTYHTFWDQYLHYLPGTPAFYRKAAKFFTKYYCNKFPLVLAPSQIIESYLLEYGIKSKIGILPSGLDLDQLTVTDTKIREKYNISKGELLFCTAGRLGKEKSFDLLLKSLALYKKKNANFKLLLMGDGPEKKALAKLTKKTGLEDNIIFTGYVSHETVLNVMAASELFLFMSQSETQGLVIVEALAMGTPVVAVEAMGVAEILKGHNVGLLAKACVQDFTEKLVELTTNQALLKEKAGNTKNVAKNYSIQALSEKLIEHYQYAIDNWQGWNKKAQRYEGTTERSSGQAPAQSRKKKEGKRDLRRRT